MDKQRELYSHQHYLTVERTLLVMRATGKDLTLCGVGEGRKQRVPTVRLRCVKFSNKIGSDGHRVPWVEMWRGDGAEDQRNFLWS